MKKRHLTLHVAQIIANDKKQRSREIDRDVKFDRDWQRRSESVWAIAHRRFRLIGAALRGNYTESGSELRSSNGNGNKISLLNLIDRAHPPETQRRSAAATPPIGRNANCK